MRVFLLYIVLLVSLGSCSSGGLEDRWADELEYATRTSSESFQVINDVLKREEERNKVAHRRMVLKYPFDEMSEFAIQIENQIGECDRLIAYAQSTIIDVRISDDFNYEDWSRKIYLIRDSLVVFLANYTDDKGNVYSIDLAELNATGSGVEYFEFSEHNVSRADTALIRTVYDLLEMPTLLLFEKSDLKIARLQKQMYLNSLSTSIQNVKNQCQVHILSRYFSPCGFNFINVLPSSINGNQLLGKDKVLKLSVRMSVADTSFRNENYFNLNTQKVLFKENNLSIKVNGKGKQTITGTVGVAEKGVLVQKPWFYTFYNN